MEDRIPRLGDKVEELDHSMTNFKKHINRRSRISWHHEKVNFPNYGCRRRRIVSCQMNRKLFLKKSCKKVPKTRVRDADLGSQNTKQTRLEE